MALPRPRITGITLNLLMPDGSTKTHAVDPDDCDALAWSDRAVQVLGQFYDRGGPAEGKQMTREDFLQAFPHGGPIIGDQAQLDMTPEAVDQIWNQPKADGTGPGFLCKSKVNVVNG